MVTPIFISYALSVLVIILFLVIKAIKDKRKIMLLQKQIQVLKDTLESSRVEKKTFQSNRQLMLEQQYKLFVTTQTYRDLCLLYELRTDQVVNEQTRSELVRQVLTAYSETISPFLESEEFQQEEVFICLMYYMGFRTRHIAACLGVTVDAIRKRKSRLRNKLDGSIIEFFGLQGKA